jgi:preprotein translocase subunit SecG
MSILYYLFLIAFLLICFVLCSVILLQEGKGGGLGASFGGDASDSLFGTQTADVLKKFTAYMAVIFVIFCLILSIWTQKLAKLPTTSSSPFPFETIED